MAYRLKWQIPFVNDKGARRVINIYVNGYEGAVVMLEGSDSPISTQETTDDDMLCPIRTQTGYIRVIDNGELDGMTPSTNTQHKVTIDDEAGNTLWIGYMKAAEYTASWSARPNEVRFPIISRLEALGSIDMDDERPMDMITLGELIAEAAEAVGDVDNIYFPAEYRKGSSYEYWLNLKMSVSRANFFKASGGSNYDDPDYNKYKCDSYRDMLEKICTIFGWCLHERGKNWVFASPTASKHFVMKVAQAAVLLTTPNMSCTIVDDEDVLFDTIQPAGIDHKRDILQGNRTFEVEAQLNDEDDFLPKIDKEDFKFIQSFDAEYTYLHGSEDFKRHGYLADTRNESYTFKAWNQFSEEEIFDIEGNIWCDYMGSVTPNEYRAVATYGKIDLFKKSDINDGTKKRYDYKEGIIVRTTDYEYNATNYPIAIIRGKRIANLYGGALVWNPSITYDKSEIAKVKYLWISVRIGDKYWTSAGRWVFGKQYVKVQLVDDGTKVIDMKTLSMPYNEAEGYIMPISGVMSGEVELTLYAVYNDRMNQNIVLTDFDLKYCQEDDDGMKNEKSSNIYYAVKEGSYQSRKKVETDMATDNNNKPGYGILFYGLNKVGEETFNGGRLETILLGKLKAIFGRTIEKLTLHVEANASLQPLSKIVKDGQRYQLLSESRDWMTDESTIIIESLPNE